MKKEILALCLIVSTLLLSACTSGMNNIKEETTAQPTEASTSPDATEALSTAVPTDSETTITDEKEKEKLKIEKLIQFKKGNVTRSVQGMSIYGGKLFQLYHTGLCNVYDLESGNSEPIASFALASASADNHANNCNFSNVFYKGNNIPLLYVVDGNSGDVMKCSVENITENDGVYSSEKVQEINLDQSGFEAAGYMKYWGWPSWLVSTDGEYLWLHGARFRTNGSMDAYYNENRYIITKFRLPSADHPSVVLTADNVVDQFVTEYNVNFTQGGTVYGKYLFYTFGTGKESNPSAIRVWDLEKKVLLGPVDVSEVKEEIEDCCVVGERLYFITQKCNLYYIGLNEAVSQ